MKFLILSLVLTLSCIFESIAQSDSLIIKLKNNQTEKIAVSQIKKIQFENVTDVNEQIKQTGNLAISGNYPNPFKELTNIEFEINFPGNVTTIIYDNSGNLVQKLVCENCLVGKNTLLWNCLDKNNNRVQSGVYYYEVQFNNEIQAKKMIMVK